jgi:NADPH:quinone reductase-like Zn-dependent oxidoreductase
MIETRTYQAVQAVAPGKRELTEKPLTDPGPGYVRIRLQACGVCHSDAATVGPQATAAGENTLAFGLFRLEHDGARRPAGDSPIIPGVEARREGRSCETFPSVAAR